MKTVASTPWVMAKHHVEFYVKPNCELPRQIAETTRNLASQFANCESAFWAMGLMSVISRLTGWQFTQQFANCKFVETHYCNKKFTAKSGSYLANEPLNWKSASTIQWKCPQLSGATVAVSIGPELMENERFSHHGSKAFFCILLSKNRILFNRNFFH